MRVQKPTVSEAHAEECALEFFGIEARASVLPGEIDRNFVLRSASGIHGILKIAPTSVDRAVIESQIAALQHLQNSELQGLVPQLRTATDGRALLEIQDDDGNDCFMRMVSYLEGTPLASCAPAGGDLQAEIGRSLGRLDVALGSFDHPGVHRHLIWDLTRLQELHGLLAAVDPEHRSLVETGLERFAQRVQPLLGEMPQSVIHNDANDYNLLVCVEDNGKARLSGIIDFGDMLHSITVAELAIACTYAMLDATDPWGVAREVTRGYEQARPLLEIERRLLPDLIVGRLCGSLLLAAEARRRSPDDEYLTVSERPASDLLRRLSLGSEKEGWRST